MKLLADGGSTKIDWVLIDNEQNICVRHTSVGINPTLMDEGDMMAALECVVGECSQLLTANEVEFYGAGCTPVASPKMKRCLEQVFRNAEGAVVVGSDIIGAAVSLLGDEEGIACILGTGACSCHWGWREDLDGMGIVGQTPALGFILGDEGSGAVLGRMFINALYKGVLPETMRKDFEEEYGVDMYGVIDHVYRQPSPNRWLASLSPFVLRNIGNDEVERIVRENIRSFFVRNILPYKRPDLKVSFVGSIAHYYEEQLRSEALKLNIKIGTIKKSPFA